MVRLFGQVLPPPWVASQVLTWRGRWKRLAAAPLLQAVRM